MANIAIKVRNLCVSVGKQNILHQVSTSFNQGELTVLLGPNGAGKSSLLKAISREWPLNGELFYFEKPASKWRPEVLAKHLGVLPQSSSLNFNFTVREVVELGGQVLDATQKVIRNTAERSMEETDILHFADRTYPSLSGGEKQRVHLARVLTQLAQSGDKKALLLDEPTSALDLSHQHRTLRLARNLAQSGASVVLVLHDLNLAAQYADRVLILHQGELVADGSPWETLTDETIRKVYQWPVTVTSHPINGYPVILSQD